MGLSPFQFDEEVDGSKDDVYSYYEYLAKKLNAGSKVKKNQFSVVSAVSFSVRILSA